ncbi:MAG: hypothetical protein N2559_09645, partial [Anaerolineae bacterium]|nr:hypothetical protein [Anaerolineae bacterium]
GTTDPNQDMYAEDTGRSVMAVATASETTTRAYPIGGIREYPQTWIIIRALDLVRRAAMR